MCHGVLLIDERQVIQLREQRGLVLAVAVEVRVGECHVLLRKVHTQRVESIAAEHRVQCRNQRLVDVVFLT